MYLYQNFLLKIKAVEGSGSEGASKYMGEGVTYGVFLVIFLNACAYWRACVRLLTHGIRRRTQLLTSSRCNVVIWCRIEHWWHHHMTSLWHHRPCYDVIGFPYIRHRTWPIGDLPHLGLRVHLTLVRGSTAGYSCMLGSTCWRIPISGAYFLQLYLIGLLLLRASPRALTPQNAPTHPMSVISSTSCALHTGLTSLQLVPMSTILAVQVYIFGSVSPPGWHIILPRGTHHIYI